jgi:tRNA-dihydrouridine synthase
VPVEEVASVIHHHLDRMIGFYGQRLGLPRFRKHLAAYLQPLELPNSTRIALLTCTNRTHLNTLLMDIGLEKPNKRNQALGTLMNHHA